MYLLAYPSLTLFNSFCSVWASYNSSLSQTDQFTSIFLFFVLCYLARGEKVACKAQFNHVTDVNIEICVDATLTNPNIVNPGLLFQTKDPDRKSLFSARSNSGYTVDNLKC